MALEMKTNCQICVDRSNKILKHTFVYMNVHFAHHVQKKDITFVQTAAAN